eukprot:15365049-Ditylum_brightwellii.AAC.1
MGVFYYSTEGDSWNNGCEAPDFTDLTDPVAVADANNNCDISADGPDPFEFDTFLGTDAWLTPSDECLWGGVACRDSTGCIDRIEFESDGLAGTMPVELQNLTDLRFLILEEGATGGTIPSEYGRLRLRIIDLNFNTFEGKIPVELYTPFLLQLDLNTNVFTGTIATEIGLRKINSLAPCPQKWVTCKTYHLFVISLFSFLVVPSSPSRAEVFEVFENQMSGTMPQETVALPVLTNNDAKSPSKHAKIKGSSEPDADAAHFWAHHFLQQMSASMSVSVPTLPPTEPPTESPTKHPTGPPTEPPTETPIKHPTKHPTKSTTEPPTEPPPDSLISSPTVSPTLPSKCPCDQTDAQRRADAFATLST